MKGPASILFGAAFTAFSMYCAGRLLLVRLKLPLSREEERLLSFVAGGALLSLLIFLLGALHLFYDPAFLFLGLGLAAAAWRTGALRLDGASLPRLTGPQRALLLAGLLPVGAVTFLHAMAPEWSPDGSSYHLGVIAHYYRAHGFVPLLSNMYAHLSQGAEMLFLCAYAFGRQSAAALVHWCFGLAMALLMVCWGKREGQPWAGVAGALFVYASPVVMVDGASAYNDVAVACVLFAIFTLGRLAASPRMAILLGLLAGYSYGLKYTAFLAAPYALFRLVAQLRRERQRVWRPVLLFCAAAALMVAPWIAKNLWFTGNPVAPLFNRWFPNPVMHASFEAEYTESMRRYTGLDDYRQIPLELAVRGHLLGGLLGPLFLLAPAALLALRHRAGRQLVFAALWFALPYGANVGTRFLIPALPFVSLAMATSLPWPLLPLLAGSHCVWGFPDLPARYAHEHAWRISRIPFRQALRLESEESYLGRKWPGYQVAKLVERSTPKGAVVYSFSPLPDSYTSREVWTSFQSAEGELLRDCLLMQFITDFPPVERHTYSLPAGDYEAVRAVQAAAAGPTDQWTMHEMHLLSGGNRLPREGFQIRAHPNPKEVGLIFDNAPMPRWRSWERMSPGMFVEVRFLKPTRLDAIALDVPVDQRATRTVVEGRRPGDTVWRRLAEQPVITGLPVPLGLRRLAVEELKRRGIGYLLVQPGDYMEADFRENAPLWGMREVGEQSGARVFRLE